MWSGTYTEYWLQSPSALTFVNKQRKRSKRGLITFHHAKSFLPLTIKQWSLKCCCVLPSSGQTRTFSASSSFKSDLTSRQTSPKYQNSSILISQSDSDFQRGRGASSELIWTHTAPNQISLISLLLIRREYDGPQYNRVRGCSQLSGSISPGLPTTRQRRSITSVISGLHAS